MIKAPFFTEEFYSNHQLTLEVLNKLVDGKHVADKDMYQTGEFLFMEVYDNEKTRAILSPVISDFDAYMNYSNAHFVSDEVTAISICALHQEHTTTFKNEHEIVWDDENDRFEFNQLTKNQSWK